MFEAVGIELEEFLEKKWQIKIFMRSISCLHNISQISSKLIRIKWSITFSKLLIYLENIGLYLFQWIIIKYRFKITGIKANKKFFGSKKIWNANIFTLTGASSIAPNADHLLKININPERTKIKDIRWNKYTLLNRFLKKP